MSSYLFDTSNSIMDEEKKFSCVLCGAKLKSKELLQEHFRKHANKEIDSKGNPMKTEKVDANDLDVVVSPKSNKITCDVCPMQFDSVTQAIQHKFRKHPESSTKHFCPFCGMQFPIKFTRDKHVGTHQNMSTYGSFPCSECGVIFHNTQALNYHSKSTHKRIMSIFKPVPTPPPSKKIKINNANDAQSVYYCYLCGMEYIIKFNLQKHLERSHSEEEREKVPEDLIKCITCDALFYNKKAYDNHNLYHKPDDLYVTSEEQRLQTVTRVDQDFDIRRVQLVTDKFIPVDKPKCRRKKIVTKKITKEDKMKKPSTDDELSPTSSIDDSDSASETDSAKNNDESSRNKKDNIKNNEKDIAKERKDVIMNLEIKTCEKTNDISSVTSSTENLNDAKEEFSTNENTENEVSKIDPNRREVKVIVEKNNETADIDLKTEKNEELIEEKDRNKDKKSPPKKKLKTFQSPTTKRSLRSNTIIT